MANTQETIADTIAEYRADADKMDAHELPQPTTQYLRIMLDRLEAALKREAEHIHRAMVILAGIEMPDPDYPPKLWTALEDAYDALSDALGTDGETTADEEEAKANGRHFVIQPHGDAAKLRDALETVRKYVKETTPDKVLLGVIEVWCDEALAAPPRNCDMFNTGDPTKDAEDAYGAWQRHCDDPTIPPSCKVESAFKNWLLAPATEKEGGKDGN